MKLTGPNVTRSEDVVPLQRRGIATPAVPAAPVDWPDQAIDACAPEGAYSPPTALAYILLIEEGLMNQSMSPPAPCVGIRPCPNQDWPAAGMARVSIRMRAR